MHVILRTDPVLDNETDIEGQEFHRLRGYGTTYVQRYFNSQRFVVDDDPVIADTANFAVSIGILMSRGAVARHGSWSVRHFENAQKHRYINTELWRLFDSSNLLFGGIELDKKKIVDQLDKLSGQELLDMAVPTSLRNFLEDSGELQGDSYKSQILDFLKTLGTWILAFGQVIDIKSCSDLPSSIFHCSRSYGLSRYHQILGWIESY